MFLFGFLILSDPGFAQVTGIPDSLAQARNDTLPPGQRQRPSPRAQAPTGAQVNFSAKDSLVFNVKGGRTATLYGSSKVAHESGTLTAGKISLDLDSSLVSASTQTPGDTLSHPVLSRENDRIRSNSILFNFKSEKGRFEVARVGVNQGMLTGNKVKNTSREVVFVEDGIYSTCTLDHPHYYIKAKKMKVVNEEEIFFTNAQLFILDLPYPIIFPFGYVPAKLDRKRSGLLEPTYVIDESRSRGIGLQNVGWFQYFNDYFTGRFSADIYTSGTFFLDASTQYRKRDRYNGRIQVGFSRERGLESTDPGFGINTQKRINISHNQTFSPYANLSTNIDLRTSDFFQRNSFDVDERAQTSTNSSFGYRYNHPENLYKFSISAQHNQNFRTNNVRLSGPNINFSIKQVSPFSSDRSRTSTERVPFYEQISVRYQNEFQSNFQFNPIRGDSAEVNWFEALLSPSKYRRATGNFDHYEYGFRQDATISLPGLLPSRFINLTGSINYSELWFPTTIRKSFNPDTNRVEVEQVRGFASAREFTTSLSMSTTVYGIMNKRIGNLQGFRHTLRPTLSYSYRPDFSDDFWGYYREVQTDTTGNTQIYSIFENEVFRGPGRGEVQSLNFNLSNVFETKIVNRDSTGEKKERTLRLIDRLDFNTSYNFAADSIKLSDLNATFSTRVISGIDIRANARFNFYQRDTLGNKIDRFLWNGGGKVIEPLNWNVSVSTQFPRSQRSRGVPFNDQYNYPARYDPLNQRVFHPIDPYFNQRPVQPLNSPWRVSLNFSYRWTLNPRGENRKAATLNANNIQFKLTPKWDFSTRIGYDFIEKDLTPSRFTLSRRLHMWNLNFTMNPFGEFQFFAFSLRVNSGPLSGIFQKLPLLNNLERTSAPTGRRIPRTFR